STTEAQTSNAAPATPRAKPATRTGSQSLSISPIRKAIIAGGRSHSTGNKAAGTYQRQPLIRHDFGDGLNPRRSSASTATTGPTANRTRDDSRSASFMGRALAAPEITPPASDSCVNGRV